MRYLPVFGVVLAVACGPPSAGPVVQRLLDAYAPALTLGERVTAEAHNRYRLQFAAYQGYFDSTYQGPDGVRYLTVLMYPSPDEGLNEQIPPYAKIGGVRVESPGAATTARVDARVRAVLGVPRIACYTDGYRRRVETRYWPAENGRGILFLVFRDSLTAVRAVPPGTPPFELGWAIIEFGGERVSDRHVTFEPCD